MVSCSVRVDSRGKNTEVMPSEHVGLIVQMVVLDGACVGVVQGGMSRLPC